MVVTADGNEAAFVPPQPPPRWWLRAGLALVVVAALVAGGLWARDYFLVRCGDGVRTQGPYDECIGVTDGSYVFDDHLTEVIAKIHEENRQVEQSGKPWVAVAYIEPLTLGDGDKDWDSIRQELQGAYLAQHDHNVEADGSRIERPQIKMLLANPGRRLEQWEPLVDQILSMTEGPHPVVAVAGFGQSRISTMKAVDALRGRVPMVGSTVTADSFSKRGPSGFYRAVSTNWDEASAVARHLKEKQDTDPGFTVQLIKDINDDDFYSRSLREDFVEAAEQVGLRLDEVQLRFTSGGPVVGNVYSLLARQVCDEQSGPDAVYFAGRGRDLRRFIQRAGENGATCALTVYTGDDAVGMFFDIDRDTHPEAYARYLDAWKDSKVAVEYTALAHPDLAPVIYDKPGDPHPYAEFHDSYTDVFGSEDGLTNGQAMLGHDAVLAVGRAVHYAATGEGTDFGPHAVDEALSAIQGDYRLDGVSGRIDFDVFGNPAHKALPLVSLYPDPEDEGELVYALTDASPLYPVDRENDRG